MHLYIIRFTADFLKLLARRNYYNSFFTRSDKAKNRILFWISSIAFEFLLFFFSSLFSGSRTTLRVIFFIFLNFLINFLLTFFYEKCRITHKLVITISLQVINLLSELIMGSLLFFLIPQLFEKGSGIQDTYVIVCSSILSLLILTFISSLWRLKISYISHKHVFLLCTTPIASVILLLFMPYQLLISKDNAIKVFIILFVLLSINIINHFLLQDIVIKTNMELTIRNQQNQLNYQSEKFTQLSNSYKETRRVIHEVKRFNSYITSCIQNGEYYKIIDFINESNQELEERFVKINTGNLVIDTFITNYDTMAKENGIKYNHDIVIDKEEIPMSDYHLCIILGNLLDNSFNEAISYHTVYSSYEGFQISTKLITTQNFFVIHVSNTLVDSNNVHKKEFNPEHGFGIINVQDIVKKYSGLYNQNITDSKYETTISIPIKTLNKEDINSSPSTPPDFRRMR